MGAGNCPIAIFDGENKRFQRREFDRNRPVGIATYYGNAVVTFIVQRFAVTTGEDTPRAKTNRCQSGTYNCPRVGLAAASCVLSAGSGKQTRHGRTQYGRRCTSSQVEERGLSRHCLPGFLRSFDDTDRASEPNHSSPEECDSHAVQGPAARERGESERLGARTSARPKWGAIGWRLPGTIVSVIPGKVGKELQNGPKFAQDAQPTPRRAARRGL
jgi:hypothetical protein